MFLVTLRSSQLKSPPKYPPSFLMPGVQTAFAVGSRTVGIVLKLMIWSEDSNEWPGISVLLIVPGDL